MADNGRTKNYGFFDNGVPQATPPVRTFFDGTFPYQTLDTTTKTQSGVARITAAPTLPAYSSIPGIIKIGRMVFGAAQNLITPNSTATIPKLGGFLYQYGLGQFTLGSGSSPSYTAYSEHLSTQILAASLVLMVLVDSS